MEGVCAFTSSPAGLDELVSRGGFQDVTDEMAAPDGRWMRADLDELARRHVDQPLDSLGTVRVYQRIWREESDIFEDMVFVRTSAGDKALLYYRYQQ